MGRIKEHFFTYLDSPSGSKFLRTLGKFLIRLAGCLYLGLFYLIGRFILSGIDISLSVGSVLLAGVFIILTHVAIHFNDFCSVCRGWGKLCCSACDGTGKIFSDNKEISMECSICKGKGHVICYECKGSG